MEQPPLFEGVASKKEKKQNTFFLGPTSKPVGYRKYISSHEWKKKRERAFEKLGKKCGRCGSTVNIEVHHRSYDNLYNESIIDVEIVCNGCHKRADNERIESSITDSAYSTWLEKVYGEDVAEFHRDDYTWERFLEWYESKSDEEFY